jgi:hypothetical protein
MDKARGFWRFVILMVVTGLMLAPVSSVAAQVGGVRGTVTAPGGGVPPAGTKVKLFEPGDWSVFATGEVEVGGAFMLTPLPAGLYVVKAVPPVGSPLTQSEPVTISVLDSMVDVGDLALTHPQVSGVVTKPDGTTLIGADVEIRAANGTLFQVVPALGGEFLVGGLPAGSYELTALPVTNDPLWMSLPEAITVGTMMQVVTLTLRPAGVWGVVCDLAGNPVPESLVSVRPVGEYRRTHDLANWSGTYAIGGLAPGTYEMQALPPLERGALLPSDVVTFTASSLTRRLDLVLQSPSKVVTGTVSTNTGVPVAAAGVVARRLDKGGHARALTGLDGTYHLALSDGTWAMTVEEITTTVPSDWVYPDPPQLVHFQHNREPERRRQDFEVLLSDARVTGAVALPGGGTPAFTVTVAVYNDEGIGRHTVIVPGDSGTFNLSIPNGGYKVWLKPSDSGYLSPIIEPILVPVNGTYDLGTLTLLERGTVITGTLTDEPGAGVSGVPVVAWREGVPGGVQTVSDAEGAYAVSVVTGTWKVRPAPGPEVPYLYVGEALNVIVSDSPVITDIDFSLVTANATIEGWLVDETGASLTGVDGWAAAAHGVTPTLHNGAPVRHGEFRILVPAGTYNVGVQLPSGSAYLSTGERQVTVGDGERTEITLTLEAKTSRIMGALWDPRAELVVTGVDADVQAWSDGNWVRTRVNTGNGTYLMGVSAGLWDLAYRVDPHSGYVGLRDRKTVPIEEGKTAVVSLPVVSRDGRITGTVLDAEGDPLPGATVIAEGVGPVVNGLRFAIRSGETGAFVLPVPHGEYRLGATVGVTDTLSPALRHVAVPEGGPSGGHVLRFRVSDAVISGTVTGTGTVPFTATVALWAWSGDDAFTRATVPVTASTGSYSLDVISGTTWHLGAVYETSSQYWIGRAAVPVESEAVTQDLVLTGPYPKPAPVAVTFDASQPQRIALADGTHIYIPAGAMPAEGYVTLRIVPIATLPHQRHANVYRYGYAFNAFDSDGQPITQNFNQDVSIGFAYTERELWSLGISELGLKPAYFSTTTNSWTLPESYVIDRDANRVVMQIDHFTDYALTHAPGHMLFLPVTLR